MRYRVGWWQKGYEKEDTVPVVVVDEAKGIKAQNLVNVAL
ncbi:hypothetical protein C5S39_13750 [Candidatus Methanophagaceae archaeon]|jgi:hypothetical protein|nr:hypothetical protein C5S39_13750 [Methanophagales archaeon]